MTQASKLDVKGLVADARKLGLNDQQIYSELQKTPQFAAITKEAKGSLGLDDAQIASQFGIKLQKDLGTQAPIKFKAIDPRKEAEKQYAKKLGETTPIESLLLKGSSFIAGLKQGDDYLRDSVATGMNKLLGTSFDNKSYERNSKPRQEIEDEYKLRREVNNQGFDGWGLIGEAAGNPLLVAGKGYQGVKLVSKAGLKTTAQNAAIGGAAMGSGFASDAEERLKNAAFGVVGGAAGSIVGKGLEKVASKAVEKIAKNASEKVLDAPRNILSNEARATGYTIPPSYSNPNTLNKSLAKIAGEADLAKIASSKNQEITNALAKQSLGLPINKPLTETSLQEVRQEASQAYDIVRSLGRVKVDQTFISEIDNITKPYADLSNDFQLKLSNDVLKAIDQIKPKNGEFEASAAIHAIRSLRNEAKKAFKNGDMDLGKATKSAAEALEKQLDRAVSRSSLNPNAIANFKNARQLIAKTHTIEDAMDEVGDVSANKLASMLGKGAPLSGELKQAAQFASVYPQLNNVGRSGGNGITLFDSAAGIGGSMATGGTTGLALGLTRPSLRYLLNTGVAGKMGTPSYNSPIANLLQHSNLFAPAAPATGANISKNKSNQ